MSFGLYLGEGCSLTPVLPRWEWGNPDSRLAASLIDAAMLQMKKLEGN